MSLATSWSVALVGLQGSVVEVEAHIGGGLPRTALVGLPDASLYEARDRCKAAVANSGAQWPTTLLTINLSPATLPKSGSAYDLAITSAVLGAQEPDLARGLTGTVLLGELGLDGRVRPVRGILPAVLTAVRAGFRRAIVPSRQAGEAGLVDGIDIVGVGSLRHLIAVLRGEHWPDELVEVDDGVAAVPAERSGRRLDLADVVGQFEAKWALEVAAAGRHHLLFTGPPGVGKTMLAERLPGLLPDLDLDESLEVSAVHSLAGIELAQGLIRRPPYADPHHSATPASVVGGGPRVARPGAISLAHRGVLFLDEAPEFSRTVLDALRTPLESGEVLIARSQAQARFPARFQLVLACNPCPCGNAATPGRECTCPPMAIRRYAGKVSAPILDRIDIVQAFRPLRKAFLKAAQGQSEPTAAVAVRVAEARARQAYRLRDTDWQTNGEISGPYLRKRLPLPDGTEMIDDGLHRGRLSSRGADKVLRISWTLADLAGRSLPSSDDVAAAIAMRRGATSGPSMRVVS